MNHTLPCTNPSCNTLIEVPNGALQVICPACNTWYFPSTNEEKSDGGGVPLSNNYIIPSVPAPNADKPVGLPNYTYDEVPFEQPPVKPIAEEPKPTAVPNAYLVGADGMRLPLKEGKNIIGRKGSDLLIPNKTVSRQHCVLEVMLSSTGNVWEYYVYDIGYLNGTGSTNGVLLSNRSLRLDNTERLPLRHEMSIQLGEVKLMLICQ
ncbi:MAG: FHA domain-containing protein [Bacteroidota bacterium]